MTTIGLDLHKRESQLCIAHADGRTEERRITTSRDRFTAVLGPLAPARILLESGTESEWVARHLERMGHEVIVADPNFAPMYATRSRRTKTDRRDARTLMDACQLGAFRKHTARATSGDMPARNSLCAKPSCGLAPDTRQSQRPFFGAMGCAFRLASRICSQSA